MLFTEFKRNQFEMLNEVIFVGVDRMLCHQNGHNGDTDFKLQFSFKFKIYNFIMRQFF